MVKFSKRFYLIICLIFFLENNLITQKQSGFKPGDSCINQLLSITHEIYKSFNDGFEGRERFLDISKAFDKVWHQGIIFKLRQNDILGELLNILFDFLSNRRHSNKAQKHGNISIRMLKICGDTISKPLELIFKQVLMTDTNPSD